jgi:hypothetical protein
MIHLIHILPSIRIGGLWRHLQIAEQLDRNRFKSSAVSIFDLDEEEAVRSLEMPVMRLRCPLSEYGRRKDIIERIRAGIGSVQHGIVHSSPVPYVGR